MKRIRLRKSTLILSGFTLYSVAVYAYSFPRTDLDIRHWAAMALNAVILVALWYLYRRREKLADRQEHDMNINQENR